MTVIESIHSSPNTFPASGSSVEDPIDLTIVITCLNEAENIVGILDSVKAAVAGQVFTTEVIVSDDKSDDETYSLAIAWGDANKLQLPVPFHCSTALRNIEKRRNY